MFSKLEIEEIFFLNNMTEGNNFLLININRDFLIGVVQLLHKKIFYYNILSHFMF